MSVDDDEKGGVGSVENAFEMLKVLAEHRRPMALSEVARALDVSAGKVHRYFVSLVRVGAIRQQPQTGKYELGPMSLSIGLSALAQVDAVRFASEALTALRDDIDLSVLLAVWTDVGPVVIRSEESSDRAKSNVRVGSILPVLTSAIGRVFLTYLPSVQTKQVVAVERRKGGVAGDLNQRQLVEEVRSAGMSRIKSYGLPDVIVSACPILDAQEAITVVVAIVGHKDAGATKVNGSGETALKAFASHISFRLGYSADADRRR